MKRMFVLATLACLALLVGLLAAGVMTPGGFLLSLMAVQLAAFAVASPRPALFISAVPTEQVELMREILAGVKQWTDRTLIIEQSLVRSGLARPQGKVVSSPCAKFLGALAVVQASRQNRLNLMDVRARLSLEKSAQETIQSVQKAALTSSDIPMPVGYGEELVALIADNGAARRYCTVIEMTDGVLKLPKLKTDPAFGKIAASAPVTEKSPQTEWATFTAEKFGGLIRLPSELLLDLESLGQWLAAYCATNLALVEDWQVFRSTGADDGPNGVAKGLTTLVVDNSKLATMPSTKTAISDSTLTEFRSLRTKPDAAALRKSAYYLHPTLEGHLSTFNTSGNRPYNPNAQLAGAAGAQPFVVGPTLDGFPIRWVDVLPAYSTSVAASTVFGLFGDLSFTFLGVRGFPRIDVSTDAAFASDEILFRASERLCPQLMAAGAVAGIRTAAS